jgi:hypothetical protein
MIIELFSFYSGALMGIGRKTNKAALKAIGASSNELWRPVKHEAFIMRSLWLKGNLIP